MNRSDRETTISSQGLDEPRGFDETGTSLEHNELQARPTKAVIGIGMLIVFSLLMYEINNVHTSDSRSQPQNVAHRQITTPSPASPN